MIIGHEVCVVPQEILFRLFITAEDVLNKDNVHKSNKKVQLCFIFLTFHCDFYINQEESVIGVLVMGMNRQQPKCISLYCFIGCFLVTTQT